MVRTLSPPAIIDFLDLNYRYKSVITQILNDAGLAPNPYTGRKFPHRLESHSIGIQSTTCLKPQVIVFSLLLSYAVEMPYNFKHI